MKILITGGSRGIGRACVELFSQNGHEVIFLYHSNDVAARALCASTEATAIKCDVSSPGDVRYAVAEALKRFDHKIDALVNNAGVCGFSMFDDISDDEWRRMIDVNLSGAFYTAREVSKAMISQKSGRIVNVGSMWGKTGAACEVHYSAAKAGLRGMTMALAKELGPSGITVNCVEPGVIATDMNSHLSDKDISELCDDTPLGRIGRPEEVAELIYFLCSEKAAFITGQTIGIDGGFAV